MKFAPFKAPKMKIERARDQIEELAAIIYDFEYSARLEFVKTDRDKDPWELALLDPIPDIIPVIAGDIAHNLRSALDVMMCDAADSLGVGLSDMNFPFFVDQGGFESALDDRKKRNAPFRKLGQAFIDKIRELKPWRGGNDQLRGLHDFNNQDKHKLMLPATSFVSTTSNMTIFQKKAFGVDILDVTGSLVALSIGEPIDSDWFYEHPSESYTINRRSLRLLFSEEGVFPRLLVVDQLASLADMTENIVSEFEELTHQLSNSRQPQQS